LLFSANAVEVGGPEKASHSQKIHHCRVASNDIILIVEKCRLEWKT
jgi:hypothetical protein